MIPEEIEIEKIVHVVVRGVFGLGDFLQNDGSLPLDFFPIEDRIEKNVGQKIDGQGQMLVEDLGVVAGVFLSRKGIQDSPHGIDLLGDPGGAALFGPFEKQVLDEVGDPALVALLVARSILDPYPKADGARIGHLFGENTDAVV